MPELSTKWWNVIRRQMNATQARRHMLASCPDCGSSPMWLMQGKWGRFYKCRRFDCDGTRGAQLDGKLCKERGTQALKDARRKARNAVRLVVLERQQIVMRCVAKKKVEGRDWWSELHHLDCCRDDFLTISKEAQLPLIPALRRKKRDNYAFISMPSWRPRGLFLRKRNIEECLRVVKAAEDQLRRLRKNAWDRLYLDMFDELADGDGLPGLRVDEPCLTVDLLFHIPSEVQSGA